MYQMKISHGTSDFSDAALLRTEVFIKEQGFSSEFDDIDDIADHVVLYDNGVPIATGRVFPDKKGSHCFTIGRVCVKKVYRGKHLGREILLALEKVAKEKGAEHLQLSAQVQAKGFYETLGFASYGSIYSDEGCPHIAMMKNIE